MKTKEEILTPEKFYAAGNYPEMKDKFDMSAKIFDYYSMTQFAHDYASHLSERVKELEEKNTLLFNTANKNLDDGYKREMEFIDRLEEKDARIKELESQQQPVKEVERQHDTFCKCANYTNTDTSGQWCSKCGGQIPLAAQIKYPYF